FGDVRAQQRAKGRHRDRDERDRRYRAGALAAEPCKPAQRDREESWKIGSHLERRLSPILVVAHFRCDQGFAGGAAGLLEGLVDGGGGIEHNGHGGDLGASWPW